MRWELREKLINKICSGRFRITINGIVHTFILPSLKIKLESDYIYEEAFEGARTDGLMTEDEKIILLYERGLWSDDLEVELKRLKGGIDGHKLRIYDNRLRTNLLNDCRESLKRDRERIAELETKKSMFDSTTCAGHASAARFDYIFSKTITPFDDNMVDEYTLYYHNFFCTERQLRFIARNEPWRTMYLSQKGRAIRVKPYNWGVDQRGLILWSKMYDSIFNYDDKPESWVIDDDDMLDGWMISINKSKKNKARDNRPLKPGYNETFVFVEDERGAELVEEMNSPYERALKRRKINEASKGVKSVTSMETAKEQMLGARGD